MSQDVTKDTSADVSPERRTIWRRLTGSGGFAGFSSVVKIAVGVMVLAILMVVVMALYNNVPPDTTPGAAIDFPKELDFGWDAIKQIDVAVDWVVINGEPFFDVIRTIIIGILVPFRDFLLWLPWWLVVLAVGFVAWRMVSARFGVVAVLFLVFMCFMGLIDLLMMTLAITLTATLLCVVVGMPIGIVAAKSNRFEGILRPILDAMQTLPSFVYLIPALMLFGLGMTPAVMATCIYSVPPIIRLTNLGIRQVDSAVVEAGQSFGATPWQLLLKVQVPLAMPTVLAGLNQTVMMALAMVVIASMIGARGLGAEVLTGIARVEPGRGLIAGLAIVFAAIILDRTSQGLARRPEARPAT